MAKLKNKEYDALTKNINEFLKGGSYKKKKKAKAKAKKKYSSKNKYSNKAVKKAAIDLLLDINETVQSLAKTYGIKKKKAKKLVAKLYKEIL